MPEMKIGPTTEPGKARRDQFGDSAPEVKHCDADQGQDAIAAREDAAIASLLKQYLGGRSIKRIADDTGIHPESVRRYLSGKSRIPAIFIGAVCLAYRIDPATILLTSSEMVFRRKPAVWPEDALAESLAFAIEPRVKQWIRDLLNSPDARVMMPGPDDPELQAEAAT